MADETAAAAPSAPTHEEGKWSRLTTRLEAAIAAIPRPNFDVITNPKEMGKRLKKLCKSLKTQLKELLQQSKDMSHRVYDLLKQLARKIADLISRFFQYISDKVKSFFKWISDIIQSFKARFTHQD